MSYLFQKTPDDLFIELQDRLKRSGITNTSIDSISNILAETVVSEISASVSEFNARLNDFNLSTANGTALDDLVFNLYGFNRFESSKAYHEESVKFINSGTTDIDIPVNTKVSTGNEFNEDNIVYQTTQVITISANDSEYVPVIAVSVGSFSNVTESALVNHNIDNPSLTCMNDFAIVNGSDRESDNNFRSRALNYIQSITSNNLEYLRFNLLGVPGIFNLKFAQGYRGLGSMSVFAVSTGNRTDTFMKNALEARISEVSMPGERIYFEEGTKLRVDLEFILINTRNFSDREISEIKFYIRECCANYFVRAKRVNALNFSSLESEIKSKLNNYNFLVGDSETIFKKISYTRGNDPLTTSEVLTVNLDSLGSISLNIEDVPVLGDIDIEVSLTL